MGHNGEGPGQMGTDHGYGLGTWRLEKRMRVKFAVSSTGDGRSAKSRRCYGHGGWRCRGSGSRLAKCCSFFAPIGI